ncbi:hypothetical protein B9Z55_028992 [Caenorhabditis nigoni]|uniref:Secreted protein n=1 Tax=Caenorhabditis nigoni TaxID=1611254 RepID=A0A2G5S9H7_9PELO|nr:hypothetical protein B9Z55_028992 [Caenorhabditis nigoni]
MLSCVYLLEFLLILSRNSVQIDNKLSLNPIVNLNCLRIRCALSNAHWVYTLLRAVAYSERVHSRKRVFSRIFLSALSPNFYRFPRKNRRINRQRIDKIREIPIQRRSSRAAEECGVEKAEVAPRA